MINNFRNEFYFLSNMYPCSIKIGDITYQSAESAFQAYKSTDKEVRIKFSKLNGFEAKKLGRQIKLRSDWNDIRVKVMLNIVYRKFEQNPKLKEALIKTASKKLIEGNNWNDTFWGVCNGKGENYLGRILMYVRDKIKQVV